jgi:hypothetical protein
MLTFLVEYLTTYFALETIMFYFNKESLYFQKYQICLLACAFVLNDVNLNEHTL